jgi:DNA repair exonuclease SbcCD ATPase subunit
MNQRATDTPEQVLKFAPRDKVPDQVAQLDDAGQAIVTQIRTAADLAKEDCDRAMSLAHKLSMELRATEDRTQQMAREAEHWRERAACAEQWLRTIQEEIEEKLLARRPFSGGEEVASR